MKVTVKQTTMVRPAEEPRPPPHKLWLSNLDLLQPKTHVTTIYAYKASSPSGSNFFDAKVMKEALSKALVQFYPMAGRLARDCNGRLEVDCNGEGVLFEEAESPETEIDELGELLPGPEVRLADLIPAVDYSQGISSYPLLVVKLTRFKCGGVCLGIGSHHAIGDGLSALDFINTWSNLTRSTFVEESSPSLAVTTTTTTTTTLPFLDRTILRARHPGNPKFHHTEYDPRPTMMMKPNESSPEKNPPKPPPIVALLKITPDQLDTLKHKASASATTTAKHNPNRDEVESTYSTYEILTAHIWRCASKARGLDDRQPTMLQISVDGRSRLRNPPLPPRYFGNVIFHATPVALAGELSREPMAATVERLRRAIRRMDDEYLRSAIDYLEDPGGPEGVIRVPALCRSPNIRVVSWMRLPLGSADFGWGSPILTRKAEFMEGAAHILPINGDGSLSLTICLDPDVMEGFRRLFFDL